MERLRNELAHAVRSLLRSPGHATICVALLAIGIASTTAIVAIGHSLFLRPLPVSEDERLIVPFSVRGDSWLMASSIEVVAWREADSLSGLTAATAIPVTLTGEGEAERIGAARIEASYLPLLGVAPVIGRPFDEREAQADARVSMLGFGLWQRRFGGDPAVLGQTIRVDGEAWEIIGVLPPDFDLPFGSELWRPLSIDTLSEEQRVGRIRAVIGRLAPGRTSDEAAAELALISERLARERPDTNAGWEARIQSLRQSLLDDRHGSVRQAATVMLVGAGFLLLIACANVMQLSIVRGSARSAELGTRLAVGGSPASLARMLLLENLTVALVGGLVAVPLSLALYSGVLRYSPLATAAFSAQLLSVSYDARVFGAVALLVVITGAVSGLYPALRAAQVDVTSLLTDAGRATGDSKRRFFFELAVLVQVGVTVALLVATGTLAESYGMLRNLDVGFDVGSTAFYELPMSPGSYSDHDTRSEFGDALVDAARGIDGVRAAGFSTNVPLSSAAWVAGYVCEGRPQVPGQVLIGADRLVGPGYLEALGARLIAGRTIDSHDVATSELVVVINEFMARQCWPGENPIGRRVRRMTRGRLDWMKVVGLVADVRELSGNFREAHASWYIPHRQHDIFRDVNLVVSSDGDPLASAAAVRAIVARLDPHQPVAPPRLLSDHIDDMTGSDRMAALVMAYFAILSVVLVSIGIYGTMARYVALQRRAIGTRMALGAGRVRIVALVVGRGALLGAAGALLGMLGALFLGRLTEGFVYGALVDATTRMALAASFVLVLTTLACAVPAQRAVRIDPARLLRH